MPIGVETTDFTSTVMGDWGISVVRTPITKTTDPITGDETLTAGSTAAITAVFLRKEDKYFFDKEGLIENSDAYIMVQSSQSLNKDDVITANGANYRVEDVMLRYNGAPNNEVMFKYGVLFQI